MKRLLIISAFFAFNLTLFAQQKVTREQAIEIGKALTSKQDVNVYISKHTISARAKISTMYKPIIAPDFENYLIFIDEHPYQSWWHACKYVFVNINTGEKKTINMKYPPNMKMLDVIKEKIVTEKGELFNFKKKTKNFTSTNNDWAVIISGGYNKENNFERFWNDCSSIYSALINVYGYRKDHIYVLMSDGTNPANDRHLITGGYDSSPLDLDGDGDNDIQYAATRANITSVFDTLAGLINSEDNLFIYTTDHGGQENGQNAIIYLWGQTMRDDEFAAEVNKINAQRINIVMEQCFSGGFIDDLQATNRVITTACKYDESSYSTSDFTYDEFVYHWTAAVTGETPEGNAVDADINNDGFVSMLEAFNYSKNHDTKAEHPQYSSIPETVGQFLSLSGIFKPYITGSSIVCTSGTTFTLNGRPSNTTVYWTHSSDLEYLSGQGTDNYVVKATTWASDSGWVQATISGDFGNINIRKDDFWVGKPGQPITNPSGYPTYQMTLGQIKTIRIVSALGNPYGYIWNITGSITKLSGGGSQCTVEATTTGIGNFYVNSINVCGTSMTGGGTMYVSSGGGGGFLLLPNPADNNLTVEINDNKTQDNLNNTNSRTSELRVYDKMMNLKMKKTFRGRKTQINVRNLKQGVYILQIISGNKNYKKEIMVRHH